MVEGDKITISGIIENTSDKPLNGQLVLATGKILSVDSASRNGSQIDLDKKIKFPPHTSTRIDFTVTANSPGTAKFVFGANGKGFGDVMVKSIPVHEYGIIQTKGNTHILNSKESTTTLELPDNRTADTSEVIIILTPSRLTTLLESLPYLIDYPYGCVE